MKRSTAILCGNDLGACRRIFKNINEIYKVRSKIVHGEKYDLKAIEPYLVYLNAIVSLLIIELLIHNIDNKIILNEKITEIGYGNRNLLSEDWKEFNINPLIYKKIRFKTL